MSVWGASFPPNMDYGFSAVFAATLSIYGVLWVVRHAVDRLLHGVT